MGNICRSPAGENVMRHLVTQAGLDDRIICDSAGTIGYHVGEKPDPRMSAIGLQRGIHFQGRSRQFRVNDFDDFDLILAMDEKNLNDILRLARTESDRKKVKPFCHFVEAFPDREVPDPYYGGPAGFEHVMDLMADGCQHLLKHLQQSPQV
jgi:protein-tyrosine phosphatase